MATKQTPTLLRHIRRIASVQKLAHLPDRELLRRFAAERDEAAFAALVRRHGPMVLHVGRRVLHNGHDAEDVFQATFLVLTRKAPSLRWQESIGNWLYEVAHRIALKAKTSAARRSRYEARVKGESSQSDPQSDLTWRELEALLDGELLRLPVKYRIPLVLCYLEGSTRDEAAQQLGWSLSTLKRRLERGRELLRLRLVRRGLTLSAALFAPMLMQSTAQAALAAKLVQTTVWSVLQLAAGQPIAGLVSAQVAALVEGGLKTMLVTNLKVATALLLAVSILTGAGALTHQALAGKTQETPPSAKSSKEQPAAKADAKPQAAAPRIVTDDDLVFFGGRVLGPDGKPVAGAKLSMTHNWGYLKRPAPSPVYATTEADGTFRFSALKSKFGQFMVAVVATAAGYGPAWVDVRPDEPKDNLTLRLVKDDVPISGQILDLQGKPVRGATVRVLHINAAPKDDLNAWLKAAQSKTAESYRLEREHLPRQIMSPEIPELPQKATTDADGRFRLTGIGRERMVFVTIEGPGIATKQVRILTRSGETIEVPESLARFGIKPGVTTYHGATFKHAAGPTIPIVGVVRDRDTKKPLAGATVQSYKLATSSMHGIGFIRTTTDADGRYRLLGMPKGEGNKIMVVPKDDQPYLLTQTHVPDSPGLDPVTVDFDLKQGVWIEGRVTDKVTGKSLHASVEYYALTTNPNLRDHPGFQSIFFNTSYRNSREDGTFQVIGIPGAGVLAVQYSDHYLLAHERDDEYGTKDTVLNTAPHALVVISYNAVAPIVVNKDDKPAKRDVTLDPGQTFKGTVLGPDGKPLAGARAYGLSGWGGWEQAPLEADFTVQAFNLKRPRPVVFQHLEKGLVGILASPKNKTDKVTVKLQPGATVKGRLVDVDGQPRASVELDLTFRGPKDFAWAQYFPNKIKTDPAGRFRTNALLPGYRFDLRDDKGWFSFGETLRAGETEDLGDVQVRSGDG